MSNPESSEDLGTRSPLIRVRPPGPASRALAARLAAVESRNVTLVDQNLPVFWEAARGSNVRDVDGNIYVDLCGAFGVAIGGHRHPRVTAAVVGQQHRLVHGMGDLYPAAAKVDLLERLCRLGPWPEARAVLACAGSEAVEIALKTALLHTGKPGLVAFEGAYHGLTLGALSATHRSHFRAPFSERTYEGVSFAPFPDPRRGATALTRSLDFVSKALDAGAPNGHAIGAVLVEPVQGRAGVRVPPEGFLERLGALVHDRGAIVIADEVFTGLGRCGTALASTALGLEADLVCLGKALGGGFPLSACLGDSSVMDAWPESDGEAMHTSTFLGHPVACAAGAAILDVLESEGLARRSAELGEHIVTRLQERLAGVEHVGEVRGMGLLVGVELVAHRTTLEPLQGAGARVARRALADGLIVLPAGEHGHVLELAPAATIPLPLLDEALESLAKAVEVCGP